MTQATATTAQGTPSGMIRGLLGATAVLAVLCAGVPLARAQDVTHAPAAMTETGQPAAVVNIQPLQEAQPIPALENADGTANASRKDIDNTALLNIADSKGRLRDASVLPSALQTLFFTAWQHALLQEAKEGFKTRLPNPGEVGSNKDPNAPRDPGIREITLGGIAFGSSSKWTVWLNGVRITPDAIPPQVLDIKVSRTYIDLKWYDNYTNKIYPIRMRTHERFNLDSRIFLPGTPAGAM